MPYTQFAKEQCYGVLGLKPSASSSEVIEAFHKVLISEFQPDKAGADKESALRNRTIFVNLRHIYDVLLANDPSINWDNIYTALGDVPGFHGDTGPFQAAITIQKLSERADLDLNIAQSTAEKFTRAFDPIRHLLVEGEREDWKHKADLSTLVKKISNFRTRLDNVLANLLNNWHTKVDIEALEEEGHDCYLYAGIAQANVDKFFEPASRLKIQANFTPRSKLITEQVFQRLHSLGRALEGVDWSM